MTIKKLSELQLGDPITLESTFPGIFLGTVNGSPAVVTICSGVMIGVDDDIPAAFDLVDLDALLEQQVRAWIAEKDAGNA